MPTPQIYEIPLIYNILQEREHPPVPPVTVSVPGSKSITNRALLLATLADGTSTLNGALFSDDSRHFLKCIQDLGFETHVDEANRTIVLQGKGGAVLGADAQTTHGSLTGFPPGTGL